MAYARGDHHTCSYRGMKVFRPAKHITRTRKKKRRERERRETEKEREEEAMSER